MNIIKAERTIVKFSEGLEVDAYRLPNGELRVSKRGASVAVGYGKDWADQLAGKSLKALQDKGYTGAEKILGLERINGGGAVANTISLQDFRKLITFAASKGKPQALVLVDALLDTGLEDWVRQSFGEQATTLDEKRQIFYRTYSESIDWLSEDRQDWKQIQEQEHFLSEEY